MERLRKPLLTSGAAVVGTVLGGYLGAQLGAQLSLQVSDFTASGNFIADGLSLLFAITPLALLGGLIGALLGWLAAPPLLGLAGRWPRVWVALGVQVVGGMVAWLVVSAITVVIDFAAGMAVLVGVAIVGPPAAGRWFVDRDRLSLGAAERA